MGKHVLVVDNRNSENRIAPGALPCTVSNVIETNHRNSAPWIHIVANGRRVWSLL